MLVRLTAITRMNEPRRVELTISLVRLTANTRMQSALLENKSQTGFSIYSFSVSEKTPKSLRERRRKGRIEYTYSFCLSILHERQSLVQLKFEHVTPGFGVPYCNYVQTKQEQLNLLVHQFIE